MSRTYDRPISIQRINETTETWEDAYKVHASINKTKADNQYLDAGSIRSKKNLTFEIRYFSDLEDISFNLQAYRIIYQGVRFQSRIMTIICYSIEALRSWEYPIEQRYIYRPVKRGDKDSS